MLRATLGLIVGVALWMTAFFALTFAIAFAWPAYAAHGQTWFESGVFTFEPPMAVLNVVCWASAEVLAGWAAVAVGRRREVGWTLAAVLAIYLGAVHLYLEWPKFPWWYNLGVAALAAPAVLIGGKLASGFARPIGPAAAAIRRRSAMNGP